MPTLKAFRGVRYTAADDLGELTCPPYDIISDREQEALHARHDHNAVRLELAKKGGPEGYGDVAATFRTWLADGVLTRDATESLYVYRQDFTAGDGRRHRVVGVIGALSLEEFGQDSGVLPHEKTMPGPIEDRLALLDALQVNVSPIYGIYRGEGSLNPFYGDLENRPTAARFADERGILHRLWVISAPAEIEMLTTAVGAATLVIADGHHRYETALTYHRAHRDEPGDHDAIMCFCVDDAEDLVVLPYNRALKPTGSPDVRAALEDAGATEIATSSDEALSASGSDHPFVFLTAGGPPLLIEVSDDEVVGTLGPRAEAWRGLDVVALHEVLLPRLFPDGLADIRFSKEPEEVEALVGEGGFNVGVLLRAMSAPQIVDVARSGERMPQKASYFWPKAVTGLVFRPLS